MNKDKLASICDLGRSDFEGASSEFRKALDERGAGPVAGLADEIVADRALNADFDAIACLMYLFSGAGLGEAAAALGRRALERGVDDDRVIVALADVLHRSRTGDREFLTVLKERDAPGRSVAYKHKLADYSHDAGLAFISEHHLRRLASSGSKESRFRLAELWGVRRDWRSASELLRTVAEAGEGGDRAVYLFGRCAVSLLDEDGVVAAVDRLARTDDGLSRLLADVWRWRIGLPLEGTTSTPKAGSPIIARDRAKMEGLGRGRDPLSTASHASWRLAGATRGTVDALVIGAQRAGTSWLWSMLNQGPAVRRIGFKEPVFFSDPFTDIAGFPPELRSAAFDEADRRYWEGPTRSLRDYARLFEAGDGLRVDVSPTYAELPDLTVRRAAEILGRSTKIVFLLRDPVERAWSNFCYDAVDSGVRPAAFTFAERTAHYLSRTSMRRGKYLEALRRWRACFDRVEPFFFDEIVEDPDALLGKVRSFLELPNPGRGGAGEAVNRSDGTPMPRQDRSFLLGLYRQDYDDLASEIGGRAAGWLDGQLARIAG